MDGKVSMDPLGCGYPQGCLRPDQLADAGILQKY